MKWFLASLAMAGALFLGATLNAEEPAVAMHRHVADFRNGSPCSFARGGMDEDGKSGRKLPDGRFGLGVPGWLFTCGDGEIAANRLGNGTGLGAADLGTGMGGGWPRPLIRGGLFVRHPRPGFGPYPLPVTLKASVASPKHFLAADTPADGRPKFLGVCAELRTAVERDVPDATKAWDVMRPLTGKQGLYGYEMWPRAMPQQRPD